MNWFAALKYCRALNIGLQLAAIVNEKESTAIAKWLGEQKARNLIKIIDYYKILNLMNLNEKLQLLT